MLSLLTKIGGKITSRAERILMTRRYLRSNVWKPSGFNTIDGEIVNESEALRCPLNTPLPYSNVTMTTDLKSPVSLSLDCIIPICSLFEKAAAL